MKRKRLTTKDVAAATGMSESTIRRWTDRALIPCNIDWRGGRVFHPAAIVTAKKLAGTAFILSEVKK